MAAMGWHGIALTDKEKDGKTPSTSCNATAAQNGLEYEGDNEANNL